MAATALTQTQQQHRPAVPWTLRLCKRWVQQPLSTSRCRQRCTRRYLVCTIAASTILPARVLAGTKPSCAQSSATLHSIDGAHSLWLATASAWRPMLVQQMSLLQMKVSRAS